MKIALQLGDKIVISPEIYPDRKLKVQPGDLSVLAPNGTGVYGYQPKGRANPFTDAPPHEANGGLVYFDNRIKREDFNSLLRIFGIRTEAKNAKDYSVFLHASDQPKKDGYIHQLRIVPKFGMRYLFDALTEQEYDKFPPQSETIADALWTFIERSKETFGTSFDAPKLQGLFGGDGHFACEQLSFGIMLENDYYGIVRIWSRAWLVTK